jgi:hypothetical protein
MNKTLSWDDLITKHDDKPPRLIIHGQPKTGKTTFACSAPRPLVICTEDGLGRTEELANVNAFRVDTLDEFWQALDLAMARPEMWDTLVIDSLDHLEPLITDKVCRTEGVDSIEKIGYGKGFAFAADIWRGEYNARMRYVQRTLKKMIIEIAHSQPTKENPPDMLQGFTRWSLKLDKRAADILREEADGIFYLTIPIVTAEAQNQGFAKGVKATAVGERRLYLQPGGGYLAGCRWKTPEWVPASWANVEQFLTGVPGAKT